MNSPVKYFTIFFLLFSFLSISGSQEKDLEKNAHSDDLPKTFEGYQEHLKAERDLIFSSEKILKDVSILRELPVKNRVWVKVISRNETKKIMKMTSKEDKNLDEELEESQKVLVKLGLIKEGTKIKEIMEEFMGDQVAGFYDDKSDFLFLIRYGLGQEDTIAHELVHALQDQNFNLTKLFEKDKKTQDIEDKKQRSDEETSDDASLARTALTEGDASRITMIYMMSKLGPKKILHTGYELFASSYQPKEKVKNTPKFLVDYVMFPYNEGLTFVDYLNNIGGWELVNKAYQNLPKSTEQILHPEKYFPNYDAPTDIKLPDIRKKLPDYKYLFEDTFGEYLMRSYFEHFDSTKENASKTAAGWDGDRYLAFLNKNDDSVVFIWKTVWDSPKDAQEFYDAQMSLFNAKYKNSKEAVDKTLGGFKVFNGKYFGLVKDGTTVIMIDGFANPDEVKLILEAIK